MKFFRSAYIAVLFILFSTSFVPNGFCVEDKREELLRRYDEMSERVKELSSDILKRARYPDTVGSGKLPSQSEVEQLQQLLHEKKIETLNFITITSFDEDGYEIEDEAKVKALKCYFGEVSNYILINLHLKNSVDDIHVETFSLSVSSELLAVFLFDGAELFSRDGQIEITEDGDRFVLSIPKRLISHFEERVLVHNPTEEEYFRYSREFVTSLLRNSVLDIDEFVGNSDVGLGSISKKHKDLFFIARAVREEASVRESFFQSYFSLEDAESFSFLDDELITEILGLMVEGSEFAEDEVVKLREILNESGKKKLGWFLAIELSKFSAQLVKALPHSKIKMLKNILSTAMFNAHNEDINKIEIIKKRTKEENLEEISNVMHARKWAFRDTLPNDFIFEWLKASTDNLKSKRYRDRLGYSLSVVETTVLLSKRFPIEKYPVNLSLLEQVIHQELSKNGAAKATHDWLELICSKGSYQAARKYFKKIYSRSVGSRSSRSSIGPSSKLVRDFQRKEHLSRLKEIKDFALIKKMFNFEKFEENDPTEIGALGLSFNQLKNYGRMYKSYLYSKVPILKLKGRENRTLKKYVSKRFYPGMRDDGPDQMENVFAEIKSTLLVLREDILSLVEDIEDVANQKALEKILRKSQRVVDALKAIPSFTAHMENSVIHKESLQKKMWDDYNNKFVMGGFAYMIGPKFLGFLSKFMFPKWAAPLLKLEKLFSPYMNTFMVTAVPAFLGHFGYEIYHFGWVEWPERKLFIKFEVTSFDEKNAIFNNSEFRAELTKYNKSAVVFGAMRGVDAVFLLHGVGPYASKIGRALSKRFDFVKMLMLKKTKKREGALYDMFEKVGFNDSKFTWNENVISDMAEIRIKELENLKREVKSVLADFKDESVQFYAKAIEINAKRAEIDIQIKDVTTAKNGLLKKINKLNKKWARAISPHRLELERMGARSFELYPERLNITLKRLEASLKNKEITEKEYEEAKDIIESVLAVILKTFPEANAGIVQKALYQRVMYGKKPMHAHAESDSRTWYQKVLRRKQKHVKDTAVYRRGDFDPIEYQKVGLDLDSVDYQGFGYEALKLNDERGRVIEILVPRRTTMPSVGGGVL